MQIAIRPYCAEDLSKVVAIWLRGWNSTGILNNPHTAKRLREEIPSAVARGTHEIFVATYEENSIGFVILEGNKIDQLYVDPEFQNRGVGKQLVDFSKVQKPNGLWLTAIVESVDAIRFYEREGFQGRGTSVDPGSGHQVVRYEWQPD